MDKASLNPLDERYFLPDERRLSDFLKFVNRISKKVNFIDENLNPNGDWYDFFISDELFLLAEIGSFDLKFIEQERTKILLKFENSDNQDEKKSLITQLFAQIKTMLKTIDEWYLISSKFNKQRQSTPLELELVAAITYRCKDVYGQLLFINEELINSTVKYDFGLSSDDFHSLWNVDLDPKKYSSLAFGSDLVNPDYLYKQLLLLHRPVFKTLINLIDRSGQLIRDNLQNKEDHEPHIGLILAFFNLFQKLQGELNEIPVRLLNFYYKDVLGQNLKPQEPDTILCYVNLDPDYQEVVIPKNTVILAGQNIDGQDIKYAVNEKVKVSDVNLAGIYTFFVSRNKLIDPGTTFETINGIYSKYIEPNLDKTVFTALGEEQRFLSDENRTMDDVYLGFIISSPTLKLKGGSRKVLISFTFLGESFQYFLTMLISVAKVNKSTPEEVFYQIFSDSLDLKYTSTKGWQNIEQFEVIAPQEWNENGFKISFELGPAMPEFNGYKEDLHKDKIDLFHPALKVLLNNKSVFHPYSFLQFLEIEQINIEVEVSQLKKLTLHSSYGPLDQSIPFDLLGPSPKVGSYLLVGSDEVFSKDLDELKVGWTFHGLPEGEDMESYFRGYPFGIKNDSFKLQIQALSDFRYIPTQNQNAIITNLFSYEKDGLNRFQVIDNIDLSQLRIQPDYNLGIEEDFELSLDGQTGFLKLELVSPSIGFGFDVYTDVYNKSVTMSTNQQIEKPTSGFSFDVPKEPFSPMAKDIFIDYKASSKINFLGTKSFANQKEKSENFIQVHPFGKKYLFKENLVFDNGFLPFFELQGALFLGIEARQFPQELSILFDIGKNEKWYHGDIPKLDWFYLSTDEWKPFRVDDLLFDTTYGLTRSGIISFKSPKDINQDNLLMPKTCYWICCRTKENAELASMISGIHLNAFSATALLENNTLHEPVLPKFSVESFENNIPGILDLIQPIDSRGGKAPENQMAFFRRVSESIKHKFRAVTSFDIEKILLNEFSWLGLVRVFGSFGNEQYVKPGTIFIVGIPEISNKENFYLPRLNPGQIKEMEYFLEKYANPFMTFKVINPQYEYLLIKGKIKFHTDDIGMTFRLLYDELLASICPWFYGDLSDAFLNRETKKSEILNLIISRPYVNFFTGFSIAHIYQKEDMGYVFLDGNKLEDGMDKVNIGKPWSILVPYQLKNIEIVEDGDYKPSEPFDLRDFIMGENLIVTSDYVDTYKVETKSEEIEKENEDDFHITIDL